MTDPVDFVSELIDAAVETIAESAHFATVLGLVDLSPTDLLKVEYAREGNEGFLKGRNGTCRVYPGDMNIEQTFTESVQVRYEILLVFDLIETKTDYKQKSLLHLAVASAFGDRGDTFFSNLNDSESNRLGKSGNVLVASTQEGQGRGPSNPIVQVTLEVSLWQRLPAVIVETP
jgi:hypothetical protein